MSTVIGPARTAGSAANLARTLVVVVIGSITAVLDVTIVSVALHPLATEFDAPLATVHWVATGYTLALCAVIPLAAWAMSRFGAKRAYLTALALFTGGSAASHPGRSPV
jgi:MFS family permease